MRVGVVGGVWFLFGLVRFGAFWGVFGWGRLGAFGVVFGWGVTPLARSAAGTRAHMYVYIYIYIYIYIYGYASVRGVSDDSCP